MSNNLKGSLILFLAALLWGTTFVVQRLATEFVGPFTFIFFRSIIAVILLFVISFITEKKIKVADGMEKKKVMMYACLAGGSLFIASTLQQIALADISASKAGFITSIYIIFVPIIGLFFKHKIKNYIWICVGIALIGSYLLSATSGFSFGFGEILCLIGSVFFALQIILVDKSCKFLNPYKYCMIQLAVVAAFAFVMMITIERPSFESIKKAFIYILYAGVLSSCFAYSLQIVGQNYAEPTIASLVMSLESVISLISGVLFLEEIMSDREIIGSILIFVSVIVSQLPFEKLIRKKII